MKQTFNITLKNVTTGEIKVVPHRTYSSVPRLIAADYKVQKGLKDGWKIVKVEFKM